MHRLSPIHLDFLLSSTKPTLPHSPTRRMRSPWRAGRLVCHACFVTQSISALGSSSYLGRKPITGSGRQSFVDEVTSFLDDDGIPWTATNIEEIIPSDAAIVDIDKSSLACRTILGVGGEESDGFKFLLHVCPTPSSEAHAGAWLNADLTNALANQTTIVHLHQDVWNRSRGIVESRLRSKCGGSRDCRIYARKTRAQRITKLQYLPFLEENHLWGATRAKFAYGLFLKTKVDERETDRFENTERLVAVATFSSKRKVSRAGEEFHSHELLVSQSFA